MIAPASLKPTFGNREGNARVATPGHDCPGLIEAGYARRLAGEDRRPLRGMIAPASLKQTAPESASRARPPATPGHDCPGLIEAGVRRESGTFPGVHSGA